MDYYLKWRSVSLSLDFDRLVTAAKSWAREKSIETKVLPWGKQFWELFVRRIPEPTIQTDLSDHCVVW